VIIIEDAKLGGVMNINLSVNVLQAKNGMKIGREYLDFAVRINTKDAVSRLVRWTAHIYIVLAHKNPAVRGTTNHGGSANGGGLRDQFKAPVRGAVRKNWSNRSRLARDCAAGKGQQQRQVCDNPAQRQLVKFRSIDKVEV
jgi:hypothetical protein